MITIHQRNQNVSNDDDTISKPAQNSLPWVLPDKYITDRPTIQLILSLLTLFSLFLPSKNIPVFEKCNVLFPLVTIHQWTDLQYQIQLMSKFPVLTISLLSTESGQASYRKVPCFTNKVLEWHKHMFQFSLNLCIHLMTRSELQFSQSHALFCKTFCHYSLQFTTHIQT